MKSRRRLSWHKKLISMFIICTSLTVRTQPSPRFHAEAWLPFRNCEMDYCDFYRKYSFSVNSSHQVAFLINHDRFVIFCNALCSMKSWLPTLTRPAGGSRIVLATSSTVKIRENLPHSYRKCKTPAFSPAFCICVTTEHF